MNAAVSPATRAGKAVIVGRILSGLAILFLLMDGVIKLPPMAQVIESLQQLGYPATTGMARGLGALSLVCTLLYAIPRTSVIGAILVTGLLGGAIATHLRAQSPVFSHLLFGVYIGALVWGGLYLRNPRLREVLWS
jgi:hypothetical protein